MTDPSLETRKRSPASTASGSDPFYDAMSVQGPHEMVKMLDILVPLKPEDKIIRKVVEMRKSAVVAVFRILLDNDLLSFHAAEIFSRLAYPSDSMAEAEKEPPGVCGVAWMVCGVLNVKKFTPRELSLLVIQHVYALYNNNKQ